MNKENTIPRFFTILLACFLLQGLFLQPVSHARRVAASIGGSDPSIASGAVLTPPSLPDLAAPKGLKIGRAGHLVPWKGSIDLSEADSAAMGNGKCAFSVGYDLVNLGTAVNVPFTSILRIGSTEVVARQGLQPLAAGATRQVASTAYLPSGNYFLFVVIDSSADIAESDETNNSSYVTVRVNCGDLPDITSPKGITIGGDPITGAGGRFVPWSGSITLSKADAVSEYQQSGYMFYVRYDIQNLTTVTATPLFQSRLICDVSNVAFFTGVSVPAWGTVHEARTIYLPKGSHTLSLDLDDAHVVNEANETNNLYKVKIQVNGS